MDRVIGSGMMLPALCVGIVAAAPAAAQDPFGPLAPFRPGVAQASRAATCATLPDWVAFAPKGSEPVSLTIRGRISVIESGSAPAQLVLCEPGDVQVTCIATAIGDRKPGDGVVLTGLYRREGARQVVLSRCIATDPTPP
ncbi:hypothetical protein FNJ84_06310 [Paracoccus sp. M683]|uniref:hypothetical protein n=1 Tax=Paracoccus sp. M683 TaxID=2594268 RepID=UPI0011809566|nr:hypothetical protein [Paracoccus sp. M683]TRW98387.1 hypothetical protein FNJ84_06310 [Paracoccus sp. M683]